MTAAEVNRLRWAVPNNETRRPLKNLNWFTETLRSYKPRTLNLVAMNDGLIFESADRFAVSEVKYLNPSAFRISKFWLASKALQRLVWRGFLTRFLHFLTATLIWLSLNSSIIVKRMFFSFGKKPIPKAAHGFAGPLNNRPIANSSEWLHVIKQHLFCKFENTLKTGDPWFLFACKSNWNNWRERFCRQGSVSRNLRQQARVENEASSDFLTKNCGVLQGAVLAPFYFNYYTSRLRSPNDATLIKYADDFTWYHAFKRDSYFQQLGQAVIRVVFQASRCRHYKISSTNNFAQ